MSGLGPDGTVQVGTADRYLADPPITEENVPTKFKARSATPIRRGSWWLSSSPDVGERAIVTYWRGWRRWSGR